jgi:hypothetical protein
VSLTLQPPTASSVTVEPLAQAAMPPAGSGAVGGDPGAGSTTASPLELPPLMTAAVPLPPFDAGMAFAVPPLLAGEPSALAGELPALAAELPALAVEPPTLPGGAQPPPVVAAPPQVVFAPRPVAQTPFGSRRHAVPAALLLALLLAFAIRLHAEPVRAPRYLGGAARARRVDAIPSGVVHDAPAVPVRGVGRFRAPRPELAAPATTEHGVGRFRRTRSGPAVRL